MAEERRKGGMLKCASAGEKGGGKERRAHRDAEEAHLCSKGRRSHVAVGKGCRKLSDEEVYRAYKFRGAKIEVSFLHRGAGRAPGA